MGRTQLALLRMLLLTVSDSELFVELREEGLMGCDLLS